MEHADDGRQLVLQTRNGTEFSESPPSILDRLQHAKRLIQRQHNIARNRVVERTLIAHSLSVKGGCDDVPELAHRPEPGCGRQVPIGRSGRPGSSGIVVRMAAAMTVLVVTFGVLSPVLWYWLFSRDGE